MNLNRLKAATVAVMTALPGLSYAGTPVGAAITYQGQLKEAGVPLNATVDLRFELFDAEVGGNPVGSPVVLQEVAVARGLFSVELDFGAAAFTGQARWAEIAVRNPHDPGDTEPFTPLAPRQPLTAAPYALHALGPWQKEGDDLSYTQGDVGIGTATPSTPLHLSAEMPIVTIQDSDSTGAEQSGLVRFSDSNGSQRGGVGFFSQFFSNLSLVNNHPDGGISLLPGGFIAGLQIGPTGEVAIGSQLDADVRLQVMNGTDATPAGGGHIQAGFSSATNVVIDDNEIMARDNGTASTLHINNDGGDVIFGGGIQVNGESSFDLGYEIVTETDEKAFVNVSCPPGKHVIGGGCDTTNPADTIISSKPLGDFGWSCFYESGFNAVEITVYAICVNVR